MTTSGVVDWPLTARDIITTALQECAILPLGETPEADEASACLVRLNALLKSWQVGLQLQTEDDLAVTAGAAATALPDEVETILSVRLVQSATNQRSLARWERDDYFSLPNKASQGTPSVFYVDQHRDTATLYLWPVPSANSALKIDFLRKPETVTNLSQTVDLPQKYQEAFYAMLAVRCAGIFGVQPGPELVARADTLRRQAEDAERPASYTMAPYF